MGNLCVKVDNSNDSPQVNILYPYTKSIHVNRFFKKNHLCKHGKYLCVICYN